MTSTRGEIWRARYASEALRTAANFIQFYAERFDRMSEHHEKTGYQPHFVDVTTNSSGYTHVELRFDSFREDVDSISIYFDGRNWRYCHRRPLVVSFPRIVRQPLVVLPIGLDGVVSAARAKATFEAMEKVKKDRILRKYCSKRTRRTAQQHRPEFIYFAEEVGSDTVKIGISVNPESRLSTLQTSNPKTLRLIHAFEGTGEDEAELHERFAKDRIRGEWFTLSEQIKEYLRSAQEPDPT